MGDPTRPGRSTTILVVDDQESVRRLIVTILERAGYSTVEAKNAREAVALFSTHHLDLILTDIFMPEGDGLEIINEMRRLKSGVRVIVVSGGLSGASVDFLQMAHDLGATAVLSKPFREKELLDVVAKGLNIAVVEGPLPMPSESPHNEICERRG